MTKRTNDYFTSRWGFVLSMMGVAVGAGNIWRFAHVVAKNGGGSFIIPWVIFLFLWSIPLIISEIALGKTTRRAPIGALAESGGKSIGWMGAFVALVTTGILFYYSVVVGWGIRYFCYSITGGLTRTADYQNVWLDFTHSLQPLFFHIIALLVGCFVIHKGIAKGIEKSNKFLIPALLLMIVIISIRAVTLPGSWEGIQFLFTPHLKDLLNYRIWIEALTQNAWDTGAGWGLLLVYAGYAHRKESVTVNGALAAFANNAVSLLMGVTIFSAVFALESPQAIGQLISGEGASNTGLIFIYLLKLFNMLPGGDLTHTLFASIFFLAFSFAALSSMISMLQLTSQTFNELGLTRNLAILCTGALALLLGAPSALHMAFFDNQDWVWSLGLVVNGLFISIAIIRYGTNRLRTKAVNSAPHDFKLGKIYNVLIGVAIPIQAIVLIGWYFTQSITRLDRTQWWNPFRVYSVGTILMQWGIGLILFLIMNRWLVRKSLAPSREIKK